MKREEALTRIKDIQRKLQGKGAPAADSVEAMMLELCESVKAIQTPEAAAAGRRMRFADIGDPAHQRSGLIGSMPREVQMKLDECVIAGTLLKRPASKLKMFERLMQDSPEFKKAMDSATADEGGDWVPTGLSPELVAEVTQMGMIDAMHPHIVMPTQPYEVPIQLGRLTAYLASQQTASTGQTAVTKSAVANMTDKTTLTAVDIAVEVLTSKHLEEDSIVPILAFLRSEIIMSLARSVEEACINGDTTGTHQDSDIHALGATDRRKAWKGFRKHAIENSYTVDMQGSGNGNDFETWNKIRAKLGKYGINPSRLYWLLSLEGYFRALSLKTSSGSPLVITLDKMGPQATIKTGVLGSVGGSEVAVSEFARDTLNASGVYDGTTVNRSAILCVSKDGFVFGDRRDARIQLLSELYAEYQQDALLSVIRKDFKPIRAIASNPAVAIGYNLALS